MCTVTRYVVDRNLFGRTQVLSCSITIIAMLVETDEFNSPTEELKLNV